jgi:hypothetical protein
VTNLLHDVSSGRVPRLLFPFLEPDSAFQIPLLTEFPTPERPGRGADVTENQVLLTILEYKEEFDQIHMLIQDYRMNLTLFREEVEVDGGALSGRVEGVPTRL